MIEEQSETLGIPVQYLTLIGDYYPTVASNLSIAYKGIPTAVVAVPRRYSHSPVELVNLNDVDGVLKLMKGIVLDNGERKISFLSEE